MTIKVHIHDTEGNINEVIECETLVGGFAIAKEELLLGTRIDVGSLFVGKANPQVVDGILEAQVINYLEHLDRMGLGPIGVTNKLQKHVQEALSRFAKSKSEQLDNKPRNGVDDELHDALHKVIELLKNR